MDDRAESKWFVPIFVFFANARGGPEQVVCAFHFWVFSPPSFCSLVVVFLEGWWNGGDCVVDYRFNPFKGTQKTARGRTKYLCGFVFRVVVPFGGEEASETDLRREGFWKDVRKG